MRHSVCRRALLNGDLDPEVAEHLDQCERCRAFSRDLGQVGEYAQAMAPGPPPPGLADRVIAHVRSAPAEAGGLEEAAGATVVDLDLEARRERSSALLRGPRRGPLLASMSVAAVMLLLVGVLAALSGAPDVGPPQVAAPQGVDPLLTAAGRTLDVGTARVRLEGSSSATITPPAEFSVPELDFPDPPAFEPPPFQPPPPPDDSSAPPEQQEEMRRQYEAQVEEMRRQYEQYVAEAQAQYDQMLQGADVFTGLEIPDEFSFEMAISGEGAVQFPNRLRIDGTMRVVDSEPPFPGNATTPFGVAVDGNRTLLRSPDGSWLAIPGAAGPLFPVLADPDGVAELLRGAEGQVDDLGTTTLNGAEVRHYRFDVDAGLFAPPGTEGAASAQAWIGEDDGVVHKLTSSSSVDYRDPSGFRSRMQSSMTIELFDFGADVTVEIPEAAGSSSAGIGPAAMLTPYDTDMPAGFYYGLDQAPPPPSVTFDVGGGFSPGSAFTTPGVPSPRAGFPSGRFARAA